MLKNTANVIPSKYLFPANIKYKFDKRFSVGCVIELLKKLIGSFYLVLSE